MKLLKLILSTLFFFLALGVASAQTITPSAVSVSATTLLGTQTYTESVSSPTPANTQEQLYIGYAGAPSWPNVAPNGTALAINAGNIPSTLTFSATALPPGTYTEYRLILFAAGSNYSQTVYDSGTQPLTAPLVVTTAQVQVVNSTCGELSVGAPTFSANGLTATFPYTLKTPANSTPASYGQGGIYLQWRYSGLNTGAQGFSGNLWSRWATGDAPNIVMVTPANWPMSDLTANHQLTYPAQASGADPYWFVTGDFVVTLPAPDVYSFSFQCFNANTWQSVAPNNYKTATIEVGGNGWEQLAPTKPPRLHVMNGQWQTDAGTPFNWFPAGGGKAVSFVRGMNLGNAFTWDLTPPTMSPAFVANVGYALDGANPTIVRFNIDPNQYMSGATYADLVDQQIQDIWQAGDYPLLVSQDLCAGATLAAQEAAHLAYLQAVATRYKGEPVMIELTNEPHEFPTWAAWAPIADAWCKAIRAIDPGAFIVVPLDNYSAYDPAFTPLPAGDCDLYDEHCYPPASAPAIQLPNGAPFMVGEYGASTSATYFAALDYTLQGLSQTNSNLLAVLPWAETESGQDSFPLVSSAGPPASFTAAGQQVAGDFQLWLSGSLLSSPASTTTTGPLSGSGSGANGSPSYVTPSQEAADIAAALAPLQAAVAALQKPTAPYLVFSTNPIAHGTTGTVTLVLPAPVATATVVNHLSSNTKIASIQGGTVTIPAGGTAATFPLTATAAGQAVITLSWAGGSASATVTVQ